MSKNLFTVDSQEELSTLVSHATPGCNGNCDWCPGFRKAGHLVNNLAMEQGIEVSLSSNGPQAERNMEWLAWCEQCQDGVNEDVFEALDWVSMHVYKKHGMKV